jgi:hypothetical protein
MSTAVAINNNQLAGALERVLVQGDLSKLTEPDRISYYKAVCESVGLNPLTKPFEYIQLNGKLTLYALKACTDQLRSIHEVSLTIPAREVLEGVYVVTARAQKLNGRADESTGAVPIENLKGENKANAMMKAETKAKRRVTLSICGLGMLDESEVESIPGVSFPAQKAVQAETLKRRLEEEKLPPDSGRIPEPVIALWDRMGTKRNSITETINDLTFELTDHHGADSVANFQKQQFAKFHVTSSTELRVSQARELVWDMWKLLQEDAAITAEVVTLEDIPG